MWYSNVENFKNANGPDLSRFAADKSRILDFVNPTLSDTKSGL